MAIEKVDNYNILDLTPLNSDNENAYKFSVKKWKYDPIVGDGTSTPECGQFINDNYYDMSTYPHNIEIRWFVEAYTWNMTQLANSTTDVSFYADLSDKVMDISVDIDSSNNIRQSANITFLVKPDDDWWFMRRGYDWRLSSWEGIGDSGVGHITEMNPMWNPVVYKIYQKFTFPNDVPNNREVGSTKNYIFRDDYVFNSKYNPFSYDKRKDIICTTDRYGRKIKFREFGFFIPMSQGYNYDSTSNKLSLSLQSLSYGLTKEGGNVLITPIATFSYMFNMPYNNSPTHKDALNVVEETVKKTMSKYMADNKQTSNSAIKNTQRKTAAEITAINKASASSLPNHKTKIEQETDYVIDLEQKFIDKYSKYQSSHPGLQISGTAQALCENNKNTYSITTYVPTYNPDIGREVMRPKSISIEVDTRQCNVPMPLSYSGEEYYISGTGEDQLVVSTGFYKRYTQDDMASIVYDLATNRVDSVVNSFHMPLSGYNAPTYDGESTSKSEYFFNGFEFDSGVSVMDVAERFISEKFYDGRVWVDENRRLNFSSTPSIKTFQRGYLPYRYYAELIVSEDISYDDKDYYNIVEVYGKDSEYYGVYNGSDGSNFKTTLDNTIHAASAVWHQMKTTRFACEPKIKTLQYDSLESDEECFNMAAFEVWKSTRGQTTITVKVLDNYIVGTNAISHLCGNTFVEYRTMQGSGKTLICTLEKASLSGNVWTWTLKPFNSFSQSYDWFNYKEYLRIITEQYDEYIMASLRHEWMDEDSNNDISAYAKNRLSMPVVLAYELLEDNRLRLYISAIDIGYSVVKVFQSGAGSMNMGNFTGETVKCNGTDKLPYGTKCARNYDDLISGNCIYKVWETSKPLTGACELSFQVQLYSPYHEDSPSSEIVTIKIKELNPVQQNVVEKIYNPDKKEIETVVVEETSYNYLMDEKRDILTDENSNQLTV